MKKRKLFVGLLAISLALTGCGRPQARYLENNKLAATGNPATVTWSGSTALTTTDTAIENDSHVKIKTSSANTYTSPARFYANTTITITATDAVLSSVVYEASSTGNYVTYAQNATVNPTITPTVSGKFVTWSFTSSTAQFTITPSTQTRWNSISVTYVPTNGGGSQENEFKVTFETNGGTPVADQYITSGECLNPYPSTTKENDTTNQIRYWFFGWYTTPTFDDGSAFLIDTPVTENTTLYAKFLEIPYHIVTMHYNYETPDYDYIHDDEAILYGLSEPIRAGYTFLGWYNTSACEDVD